MYTVFSKPEETRGDWYLVDAAGKTLGRLASEIAHRLKGKHKPNYAPHQDLGDHIVVINAGTVRVTGAKLTAGLRAPALRADRHRVGEAFRRGQRGWRISLVRRHSGANTVLRRSRY